MSTERGKFPSDLGLDFVLSPKKLTNVLTSIELSLAEQPGGDSSVVLSLDMSNTIKWKER